MGLANQAVTPGRTSLLEAVNICLAVIGEQPINTLETQQVGEAAQAERTLLEYHKEGQTRGWSWNRERAVSFYRDADSGEVLIPASVVKFAPSRLEWNNRFQARGGRVYDTQARTYSMSEDIASIEADIVSLLPWDDCPEVFNRWATIRAARVFSNRAVGNTSTYQLTQEDENQAWADLLRVNTEQGQPNAITGEEAWATFRPAMGLMRSGAGMHSSGYHDGNPFQFGGVGTSTLPQPLGPEASPTFGGLYLSAFATFPGQLCVLGTNGAINPLPLGSGLSIANGALVLTGGPAASLSDSTPQTLGTAAAGTASTASRSDHRHAMPNAAAVGADATGTAAAAVAAHAAAADPHPTYSTAAETAAAVAAHEAAADPHPTYSTAAETAAAVAAHAAAADPHPAYATTAEASAAAPVQSVAGRTGAVALGVADVSGAVSSSDARLSDSREWSAATATQAEAEAGSSTTRLAFTPQRVFQAIAAWWAASAAKTKLDGIATGATANSSDATLLARANHTGTQAFSTITSTPTTLAGYGITDGVGTSDARLSDARTPTAHTQAASTISDSTTAGRALLTAADAAAQRTSLGLGTAATAASGDFLPTTFTAGTITYGATVDLDMAALAGGYRTISLTGALTFTTSNRASGRQVTLRLICDSTARALTFPAGWVFLGTKPSTLAASKTAVLSLTFFGTADADCVAAYGVQA